MGIESEEVAKSPDVDGGAGDGMLLRNRLRGKINIFMSPFTHVPIHALDIQERNPLYSVPMKSCS